ncbi:MAG: antitoxin [Acidimicrobiales bacterium]
MRTTIDLPDDLHRLMTAIANDRRQSLSQTVAEVLRRTLQSDARPSVELDPATNLPLVRLGRPITSEDVRSLEDE